MKTKALIRLFAFVGLIMMVGLACNGGAGTPTQIPVQQLPTPQQQQQQPTPQPPQPVAPTPNLNNKARAA